MVTKLRNLQELRLVELREVTDAIFIDSMPALEKLYCYGCPQMKNFGLSVLLKKSAKNLQTLELHKCENVQMRRIIQDAKKCANSRTNGPVLKMILAGLHIRSGDEMITRWISQYFQLTITRYYNYLAWF